MQDATGASIGLGHHDCRMLARDAAIRDIGISRTYSLTPCGFQKMDVSSEVTLNFGIKSVLQSIMKLIRRTCVNTSRDFTLKLQWYKSPFVGNKGTERLNSQNFLLTRQVVCCP